MVTETKEAVGRLFRAEPRHPDLTVVVPTYNRRDRLDHVLAKLEAQHTTTLCGHEFTFEVVVVSDGSTDGTEEMLGMYRGNLALRVVLQSNLGPAAARNAGITNARGDVVVLVDDDVFPEPSCLAAHMSAHLAHHNLVAVGPMLTPEHVNLKHWIRWEQFQLEKQYERFDSGEAVHPRQFYTGNASARRDAFLEAGLFDTTLRRSEDIEMGVRLAAAGQSFAWVAGAEAYHHAERTLKSWANVAYEYGLNDVAFSSRSESEPAVLADISRFFAERNPLQRWLVRGLSPGTMLHRWVRSALTIAAGITNVFRAASMTRLLLSAVYSLHYYEGVADGLGSVDDLRRVLSSRVENRGSSPLVVWMLLEQTLGHITHSKNLRSLLPNVREVDPVFLPVDFDPAGPLERVPGWSNWTIRAGMRARRQLRRRFRNRGAPRPDVLFVHSQVPAVLLGRWLRLQPTVVSLDATPRQYDQLGSFYNHSQHAPLAEAFKFRMHRRCFRRAAHLVTWSTWARQGLIDDYRVDAEKITVISPGVDVDLWAQPTDKRTERKLRILFVGGDLKRKGGDLLLEASRRLRGEPDVPEFELHLVTTAEVSPEPGVVVHAGLTANSPRLIEQYHAADIFCLPTLGDCLPMVLAEAGAAGLPLVSTNVAAIPTVVRDGETGLLVEPGDLDSLVVALRGLLTDRDRREAFGKSARALVEREHNAARNAEALASVFAEARAALH